MNIDNLNKLIAHLEDQPPERINMRWAEMSRIGRFGSCGCIIAHTLEVFPGELMSKTFGDHKYGGPLFMPIGYEYEGISERSKRYPAHRVIATLKRLRDTYLSTGQVVVDWGPEPGEEPKTPWVAPQVAEVIAPALPAEITSLLRLSAVKTEA